jgi:hypothetical protein
MRRSLSKFPSCVALLATAVTMTACGVTQVQPALKMPTPLMQPMKARVGLVLNEELRKYQHQETRNSADWSVDLGAGHAQMFQQVFAASFSSADVYQDLASARAASNIQALFEPRIEQYSFATARETSGAYWAVTIRYHIGVLTAQGEPIDNLTLTGYGSAKGAGGSSKSLDAATQSAMRDAAAKFLVQMPRQPLAVKLVAGQVLSAGDRAAVAVDAIEAVPIEAPAPITP